MRATIVALVLVCGGAAWAQDEATARRGLERFLKDVGESAEGARSEPRLVEALPENVGRTGDLAMFSKEGSYIAAVNSRTGGVEFFTTLTGLHVSSALAPEKHAAEIKRRVKLSVADSERRVRALLASHYPGWKERVFELTSKKREDHDGLIEDFFAFDERPREGVVAIWPNSCCVTVNPETGKISCYVAFDERVESTVKPRLTAQDALRARRALSVDPDRASFAEALLVAVQTPRGPRTAWLVGGTPIDAIDGTRLELGK